LSKNVSRRKWGIWGFKVGGVKPPISGGFLENKDEGGRIKKWILSSASASLSHFYFRLGLMQFT
jgi:hypothetical protein